MRMSRTKAKPARRAAKGAGPIRTRASAKASNWIHAKARGVRHGHRPRTMALGIVSGLLSTVLLGLWLSGYLGAAYMSGLTFGQNRLLAAGFGVDHIQISGARPALEQEVRTALRIEQGELVFAIDLQAARERIETLSWVRSASITRLLPNRISVAITERTPYAVWQLDNKLSVVNAAGEQIAPIQTNAYASLPLIVGKGAEMKAAKLLAKFNEHHVFSNTIHSVVRVSRRRWNVRFHSGSELYLPAAHWENILSYIAASDDFLAMLELPHILLDARVPGQIAIRRTPAKPSIRATMNS